MNVKLLFVLKVWKYQKYGFVNAPMLWTIFANCVENHVKNFTTMLTLCDRFHQFWNIITVNKINSDIINEDYCSLWCYMSSLIEILCVLEGKIGFVCSNSYMICMVWKFCFTTLLWTFFYFLSNWVNLLGIFSGIRELRAFEKNLCSWNRYFMPWRWIIQLLWECWKIY